MSFRSESQRRKFYQLKSEGKMDQKTIDKWEAETKKQHKELPERVEKKSSLTETSLLYKQAILFGGDSIARLVKQLAVKGKKKVTEVVKKQNAMKEFKNMVTKQPPKKK